MVIKSEKVSRLVEFEAPLMTPRGKVGVERKRGLVYDYVLDETQKLTLNEARRLARERGLALKVTDIARQGLLRRIVARGLDRICGRVWLHPNSLLAAPEDSVGIVGGPTR